MPNRILHESIKYCPKMEQLNWFEEVVYHRLTVTVDDYGCLDGRIVLLKNTLFPTREDISKDDIARAIEHMVALGLLRAYEAGGMPYLCFPAWEEEQRVRNKRRKFPAPPDEEEPLAAEDSLSAADGGALFAGEKHLTASCCQLTAGCPPESNPYPNPYPYPDSNPKFESGSVTYPYPNPYPRRVRVRALARRGTGHPSVSFADSSPQRGKLRCRKPAGGGLSTFQGADFQHSEALLAFQGAFKTRKPEYKHCNFNGHTPDFAIEEPLETQIDLRKTENPPLKSELPHLMPVITRSWAWGW